MDDARLATILRALATTPSRRSALRLLAGSALGGLFTLGTQPSQFGRAKRRGKGKRKGKKKRRRGQRCPAVCPLCQNCNPATGLCEVLPNGQAGHACAAPKVCCSETCCDSPNHFCNSVGGCATCAEGCPDTCTHCFSLADGGTACGDSGICNPSDPVCTSTADCSGGKQCATSFTNRSTNVTGQSCSKPVGTGVCWTITPCS